MIKDYRYNEKDAGYGALENPEENDGDLNIPCFSGSYMLHAAIRFLA